jgi:hypothetical protein
VLRTSAATKTINNGSNYELMLIIIPGQKKPNKYALIKNAHTMVIKPPPMTFMCTYMRLMHICPAFLLTNLESFIRCLSPIYISYVVAYGM